VSDDENKPVLDEQTFEKLLEAAHVLQEHGRSIRDLQERMELHSERLREQALPDQAPAQASAPISAEASRPSDYTVTLGEIVEVQRQIQLRHLELDKSMEVVAEKVAHITSASGAGIGILADRMVRYRAGAGPTALPVGAELPLANALCAASIRTGQVIRSEDVNTEVLFDPEPCRQRGILSLLAVPIYHDGDIVGALELYFDRLHGYHEQDIHTCRLLAGLITEAIAREAEKTLKQSVAEERSTMLAAIEKLQPNLAALAAEPSAASRSKSDRAAGAAPLPPSTCSKCGGEIPAAEQFCGNCGASRPADTQAASLQSKLASAWQEQQAAQEKKRPAPSVTAHGTASRDQKLRESVVKDTFIPVNPSGGFLSDPSSPALHTSPAEDTDDTFLPRSLAASVGAPAGFSSSSPTDDEPHFEKASLAASSTALAKLPEDQNSDHRPELWTSAAKTRNFLESLARSQKSSSLVNFWRAHRGDFYLAVALILVVVAVRWGMWSGHSVTATGRAAQVSAADHQPAPDPDLTAFDKLLISLGLAEAPEPSQAKGKPDIQVWVDLHTALYYCPGADLYGKTAKGRLTTQREAQLDQFEPANRKPCE
jgi:GAF domain-containing protein